MLFKFETSKLNQQVKRNADKFPNDFMFQITKDELKTIMMSQNVISRWGGTRKLPYAFTEQGISPKIYEITSNIIDINLTFLYTISMKSKFEIGKKLKNKRLALNLRMDDVAKEVGVTRSTLWAIENGSGNYTIDILLRLVSFLNMSIDIDTQTQGTRKRATRTNSALDKKINRFIVMCVEQYASSVNQSSGTIYNELNKAGIIDELKDDYEDMHGMSTYSINEYISRRLSGGVA